MKKTFALILVMLCCLAGKVSAQELKENLKFGNPTKEELTMEEYADEPDAEAVVLCKLRTVYFTYLANGFNKMMENKVRIKVLKQEGTEYANVSIFYHNNANKNDDYKDVVNKIEATAFNMENGKMVATKMKSNLVFRERVNDETMVVKFAIPQVKAGTVIEYEYKIQTDNIYSIGDWYAQDEIPVLYTKYDLTIPEYLHFSVENTGVAPIEAKRNTVTESFHLGGGELASSQSEHYVYEGRHVPSLKDDDYVWCVDDYRSKVVAELGSIQLPAYFKSYTMTWEDVAKTLINFDDFGGRLSNNAPLKEELKALGLENMETNEDKAIAVFDLLMSKVKWNEDYALLSTKKASSVLKDGMGSNADINFMLINMLNSVGVQAWPVAMRMRHRGRLPISYPSVGRLSTFVVGFDRGDDGIGVLDCSTKSGYVDVLPPQMMVERGLVVRKDGCSWTDLSKECKGREVTRITAEMKPDGSISGLRDKYYYYQHSLLFKEDRKKNDTVDVVEKLSGNLQAVIKNYTVEDVDKVSSATNEKFEFEKAGQSNGDIIYINPFIFSLWDENPFTQEKRVIPVERPCTTIEDCYVNLTIPEGYDVEELPSPMQIQMADKSITCMVQFTKEGNTISGMYRYRVNRLFFDTEEYSDLRQVYEHIVSKCNEMITIKKK